MQQSFRHQNGIGRQFGERVLANMLDVEQIPEQAVVRVLNIHGTASQCVITH